MSVFDKGSFSKQDKLDRSIRTIRKAWNDGFNVGWKASLDRYIPVDKDEKD
jgi:hypothetical protein